MQKCLPMYVFIITNKWWSGELIVEFSCPHFQFHHLFPLLRKSQCSCHPYLDISNECKIQRNQEFSRDCVYPLHHIQRWRMSNKDGSGSLSHREPHQVRRACHEAIAYDPQEDILHERMIYKALQRVLTKLERNKGRNGCMGWWDICMVMDCNVMDGMACILCG